MTFIRLRRAMRAAPACFGVTPETKRLKSASEPSGRLRAAMTSPGAEKYELRTAAADVHKDAGALLHPANCAAVVKYGLLAAGDDVYPEARLALDPGHDVGRVLQPAQ